MPGIAKFHKVSFDEFKKDYLDKIGHADELSIRQIYDDITLPKRATAGSAARADPDAHPAEQFGRRRAAALQRAGRQVVPRDLQEPDRLV